MIHLFGRSSRSGRSISRQLLAAVLIKVAVPTLGNNSVFTYGQVRLPELNFYEVNTVGWSQSYDLIFFVRNGFIIGICVKKKHYAGVYMFVNKFIY